jgi:sugar phosphate isomerase/epimerase
MKFVYFTKTLKDLSIKELAGFCKEAGLDGVDLTVRPGYPVTPDNALKALPEAARVFADNGLTIGLVTAPTDLASAESKEAGAIFEACAKAGVPAVKIGYFRYTPPFDAALKEARGRMAGFAKLAAKAKVKACYHTHSGGYLGNNAAGLRMLLEGLDPHDIGAFLDTGHVAVNGGPFAMEADILRPWLSLVAIKDMAWSQARGAWRVDVVPVGKGIVRWEEVGKGLRAVKFNGTVSLHGEYEAASLEERKKLAKAELAALRGSFLGK